MARQSPILRLHTMAEAAMLTYGPEEVPGLDPVRVVESFGELELEYAALRKHCILLDVPHRALIELTGKDRNEFLNRLVTQELKGMSPFRVRRSFWLSKKGRIDADLRIIDLPSRTLLELDIHAVSRTLKGLQHYIITEDVTLDDWTEKTHRLSLHGPSAMDLISALAQNTSGPDASGPAFDDLLPNRACVIRLFGAEVVIYREDQCGEVGLELILPAKHALTVYQQLLESGHDRTHDLSTSAEDSRSSGPPGPPSHTGSTVTSGRADLARRVRLRPAGWHAFNIARIEAGSPIYNLDFGPDSLPAETGIIADRVSFTKGCYLGQEIVARMHSRGHPKQMLVAIKFESKLDPLTSLPIQPITGMSLTQPGETESIGQITSSTLAPMLGSIPIALAQIRFAHAKPGVVVQAIVNEEQIKGVIQPALTFYTRADTTPGPAVSD